MPFYVADYLRDTRRLKPAEHGAYLLLIMEYWTAGGLPDDDGQLARIVGMTGAEWRKAKPIVQGFFQEGWKHHRIDDEIAKAEAKHERRAEAGKRGGIAKANAKQTASNASGNALASSSQPQPQSESKKEQEPRVNALDDDWPKDFGDQFWQAYPRRTEKLATMKKLATLRKSGIVTFGDLMAGAKRYAIAVANTDPKYTKQPPTWLNAGCWADEIQTGDPNGNRNLNTQRRSASADFFAGMRSLAEDITGDDQPPGPASPEVPLGRVNIDL